MPQTVVSDVYTFSDLIQCGFLYVDKTEFIWNLVQRGKAMYFLSRPRRFGKSLTLSTLKAVFQGRKELFKGLAIYDKPYDWREYPIIHIDMNGRNFSTPEALEHSLKDIIAEQARANSIHIDGDDCVGMFQRLVEELAKTAPVVILVDEYDKPILGNITSPHAQKCLQILKAFYSVIKAKENSLRFAFVTGVTKFCHVSLFSDLNNLTDITQSQDYATMLGYTQTELEENFKEWLDVTEASQELCHVDFMEKIKRWYDGYKFHEKAETVYNPVSIANFFANHGEFRNYWFETGTPTFLMETIKHRQISLDKLITNGVPSYVFEAFEIDDIDPACLLLQTGYLTIKSTKTKYDGLLYFLDFPNREVAESFDLYLINAYSKYTKREVNNYCWRLCDAIVDGNLKQFEKMLEVFFAGIPYDLHHKNEANFQNIFYAIFKLLGFNIFAESRTSDGRIDAVIETDKYIYLFEFKLNDDASALAQIKEKEYFKPFLMSEKKITLIGANFDTQTGKISGWHNEEL